MSAKTESISPKHLPRTVSGLSRANTQEGNQQATLVLCADMKTKWLFFYLTCYKTKDRRELCPVEDGQAPPLKQSWMMERT